MRREERLIASASLVGENGREDISTFPNLLLFARSVVSRSHGEAQ
jgi:hypothetical protein